MITIKKTNEIPANNIVVIASNLEEAINYDIFSDKEKEILKEEVKENKIISLTTPRNIKEVYFVSNDAKHYKVIEKVRRAAVKIYKSTQSQKQDTITLVANNEEYVNAFVEGFLLYDYKFLKYFTKNLDEKKTSFDNLFIYVTESEFDISRTLNVVEGVYNARDLINEPSVVLTATELANRIKKLGSEAGFEVEVFEKSKIEALQMGGLLAVNRGSIEPPTFTVMEWKPENAQNDKPFVLVGKGVVFDSGGLNIKPGNYMEGMKADMSGAAAVVGTIYSVAKNRLPLWIVGLVPATDNRPGQKAYAPDDVIRMYDGSTVEILNTDAEGRMILADALAYAKKYNPQLVIDLATLTGAAARAIGHYGIVAMHNDDSDSHFEILKKAGEESYERIVEFPFWEEYDELIESNIADIKNLGGVEGGAITAGKFLEHFTDYPYIHLDIAGPAFLDKEFYYMKNGGTGVGIRLLSNFFEKVK